MATSDAHQGSAAHEMLPFEVRYRRALSNQQLERNLLNFQRSWRTARDARWNECAELGMVPQLDGVPNANPLASLSDSPGDRLFRSLRDHMATIKDEVIDHLEEYIDQFTQAAARNGVRVYRAATADDANRYVLELCRDRGIRHVVKSKSMVSEEIELNASLESVGVKVVETDLGEWVAQLSHERPSHMVLPIIHKNRVQVGDLFSAYTGRQISRQDIGEQVRVARTELRQEFLSADLGITGANAVVADTGAIMLVTNEGNARLVTSLPRIHVVLVGVEKMVPNFAAAMLQVRLLARSATAQPITAYTTFISGPSHPDGEMHVVLLDNGRSRMRSTPLIRDALRCIRCAACANVCPPYAVVGGHVFGHIYSGAIGLVNTPYHHGLEADAGPQSLCVSCNACATVCPVGIPLPQQILEVRTEVVRRLGLPLPVRLALELWSRPRLAQPLLRLAGQLLRPLSSGGMLRLGRLGLDRLQVSRKQLSWRTPPTVAREPARDLLRHSHPQATLPNDAQGLKVAYFIQCVTDWFAPQMATAIAKVLWALGVELVVPQPQHCCGLPAFDAGDRDAARRMARQTIETLERVQADYIITGGTSCVVCMLHEYERIFGDDPEWRERAERLSRKVVDFTTFLTQVARLEPGVINPPADLGRVTYHNFCQSLNVLGIREAPVRLIRDVLGLEYVELPESNVCCGFGGSTSITHPEVASHILRRKLDNLAATGASVLVTDNPGCILHIRGGLDAAGMTHIRVMHTAELVAHCLASGR